MYKRLGRTYKLQASLTAKVVVDVHGCSSNLKFDVKAKENHDKVPIHHTGYLNSIKNPIKQDLVLVLMRQQNYLNC